jgi:hypothetical protein
MTYAMQAYIGTTDCFHIVGNEISSSSAMCDPLMIMGSATYTTRLNPKWKVCELCIAALAVEALTK